MKIICVLCPVRNGYAVNVHPSMPVKKSTFDTVLRSRFVNCSIASIGFPIVIACADQIHIAAESKPHRVSVRRPLIVLCSRRVGGPGRRFFDKDEYLPSW